MSEWISEAEIASKLGHKILIAGLSEAGKTAVKRIFFLKQSSEDVKSLSATLNYERLSITIKDTPITIVDLGGQKVFLKRFLSTFSPFVFSNVKIFIFLIDTANKTTRNNALQYFTACIKKLKTYSPEAEVFMLLHKNDLVRSAPNYDSIHEQLKESFQLEYEAPLRFFRTTIYTPETVIDAFGRIFELAIPEIKESDFVDGRAIGEIEEYHTKTMTLRQPKVKTKTGEKVKIQISSKMAGDPNVLSKLQSLMQQATKTPSTFSQPIISEEVQSETILKPIAKPIQPIKEEPTIASPSEEDLITSIQSQTIADTPTKVSEPKIIPKEPEIPEPSTDTEAVPNADDLVEQILYLVEFCRIEPEEATEVVKSGYGELFKIAASSGIPVQLLQEVFLKYLPFIHTSEGEEKFQLLTGQRLLEIFSAHLKNKLEEESMIKCLTLAIDKPSMSIEDIISKFLIPKEKKKQKEKKKKEKKTVKKAKIVIPDEIESVDGIMNLVGTQGICFKVELLENGLNAKISFYLRGATGLAENIGNSVVSANINSEEILYLLAYEMNMFNMGYFENGAASMAFSAKIVHKTILKMKKQQLSPSPTIGIFPDKLAKTIDYIIPLEIKTNGNFLLLPDTEKLAFSVEKSSTKGVLISFIQRGYPIGQVTVIESINRNQLSGLLKQAMQLPIESEGAIDFAARMIKVIIAELVRTKATKLPRKKYSEVKKTEPIIDRKVEVDEEETSEKLMHYLSLLERD